MKAVPQEKLSSMEIKHACKSNTRENIIWCMFADLIIVHGFVSVCLSPCFDSVDRLFADLTTLIALCYINGQCIVKPAAMKMNTAKEREQEIKC